ncbi:hypothetical protein VP01_941g3 [Puccinia sorghi]|uniref:Uncharacterized protein n=1 Tax=Puccinia sorghi TaxID=27349 RepID=A0A0L6U6N2_9BASI|nr:hypothetical protein VP01_941g3 [Puccinia sorghi]
MRTSVCSICTRDTVVLPLSASEAFFNIKRCLALLRFSCQAFSLPDSGQEELSSSYLHIFHLVSSIEADTCNHLLRMKKGKRKNFKWKFLAYVLFYMLTFIRLGRRLVCSFFGGMKHVMHPFEVFIHCFWAASRIIARHSNLVEFIFSLKWLQTQVFFTGLAGSIGVVAWKPITWISGLRYEVLTGFIQRGKNRNIHNQSRNDLEKEFGTVIELDSKIEATTQVSKTTRFAQTMKNKILSYSWFSLNDLELITKILIIKDMKILRVSLPSLPPACSTPLHKGLKCNACPLAQEPFFFIPSRRIGQNEGKNLASPPFWFLIHHNLAVFASPAIKSGVSHLLECHLISSCWSPAFLHPLVFILCLACYFSPVLTKIGDQNQACQR